MTQTSWLLQAPRTTLSAFTLTDGGITVVVHDVDDEWHIPSQPERIEDAIITKKRDGSYVMLFDGPPDWTHFLERRLATNLIANLNFNGKRFYIHDRECATSCLQARRDTEFPDCLLVAHTNAAPRRLYLYLRKQNALNGVPTLAYVRPEDVAAWIQWLEDATVDEGEQMPIKAAEHPFRFVRTARTLL